VSTYRKSQARIPAAWEARNCRQVLDSWLEALGRRLHVRLGDVLGDFGLAASTANGIRVLTVPTDWTIALREEEAAGIAHATGARPAAERGDRHVCRGPWPADLKASTSS
jgi:hypothetical protein